MRKRCLLLLAGLYALLLGPQIHAAGSADVLLQDGERLRVEWQGADRIRVEGSPIAPGYLLIHGRQPYMVMQQSGRAIAVELSAMRSMIPEQMRQDLTGHGILIMDSFSATGRRETVSGFDGEVHSLHFTDTQGFTRQTDVVVSQDKLAREFTEIFEAIGRAVARDLQRDIPHGELALAETLQRKGMGVLRVGEDVRLLSLEATAPASARFDLPPGLFHIPGLGRLQDH